uniref:Podocalyxin-like protein 2 n=1 Tax=Esox lucius TaxID=8010 RepID=A0A6Q2XER2_ESOLU
MESESSGLPLEPGYNQDLGPTSTTPGAPADSTTLDPQYVPVHGGPEDTLEGTVEVAEELESRHATTEPDTSRPTLPEAGVFPSFGPLQPHNNHMDDREEMEEDEDGVFLGRPGSDLGRGGREEDIIPLTTVPSGSPVPFTVGFIGDSWDRLEEEGFPGRVDQEKERRLEEEKKRRLEEGKEQEVRNGGTELLTEAELLHGSHFSQEVQQVSCVDWRDLSGKGYVVLNMSDNIDCDEFRVESGDRLLELLETAFSKKMNSPQGSWLISLSKPTRQDHQLLITLAGEHGVINSKDVLSMLGEIRRGLHETRAEELHFVENGCHDNPTLDVTGDGGQPEMLEKKKTNNQSTNGLAANTTVVGGSGGELGNSGWQVLVNKPGGEEEDSLEEDTHL